MRVNSFSVHITIAIALFIIKTEISASTKNFDFSNLLSLSSTTTWQEFTFSPSITALNEKKFAWIGLLTLKSIEPLKLKELHLQWVGDKINNLHASLYNKKDTINELIPIEENLICDGTWNETNQELIFFLNKKVVAVNKYYLVLNFPSDDASKLKHGYFVVPQKNSIKISYLR